MGNDVLSPLMNSGWLALALLAGWCVGRPFGAGVLTLSGAATLMAAPSLVATQPGGGYDDIVGLALLLASAAILVNNQSARGHAGWLASPLPHLRQDWRSVRNSPWSYR